MTEIKKGSFCRSQAGHDKGNVYIIVETEPNIMVADGKIKQLSNPKRKNPRHLEILSYRDGELDKKLAGGRLQDTDIKYSIRNYLKTHKE